MGLIIDSFLGETQAAIPVGQCEIDMVLHWGCVSVKISGSGSKAKSEKFIIRVADQSYPVAKQLDHAHGYEQTIATQI